MTDTMLHGGVLAIERLVGKRTAVIFAGALALVVAIASAERGAFGPGASTRTLEGIVFGALIPLSALGIVRVVTAGSRIDDALAAFARWGVSRRPIAAGLIGASMVAAAAVATAIALAGSLAARDPQVPSLASELASLAWIGALTGCVYAAVFALGSTFGTKGRWAIALLLFDLFLGGSGTFLALPFPRAHALNLLGGQPPSILSHWLSQGQSAGSLVAIGALAFTAAVFRCPP